MGLSTPHLILGFTVLALLYAIETGSWNWFTISALIILGILSIPSMVMTWHLIKEAFTRKPKADE